MPEKHRVQRNTLTYAQMEGRGIFGDIWKWVKKHKVISGVLGAASSILPFTPLGSLALPAAIGAAGSKLAGYGKKYSYPPQMASMQLMRMKGKGHAPKSISKAQIHSIASGFGHWLPSGGVSLKNAKAMYPKIRDLSLGQVKALAHGLGRMMKGGGVSLAGGKASGYYMKGMGYSGRGYAGTPDGRKVPRPRMSNRARLMSAQSGRGVRLAGAGHQPYKKKRVYRRVLRPVYRF